MSAAEVAASRPIWRFEPVRSFRAPPASIAEVTRTGLRGLLDRFRDQSNLAAENPGDEPLERLSPDELDRIIPPAPIDRLSAALAEALEPWPGAEATGRIRVVVYPVPGLGSEALRELARTRGWVMLESPTPDTLLGVDAATTAAQSDLLSRTSKPVVIPNLERWFLRHPSALGTIRDLLGSLALRREPTLVSCGSWAYTWLRGALQVDTIFSEPLALAALDADAMASWLGSPVEGSLVCHEYKGGQILPSTRKNSAVEQVERSDFLRHLTAEARGNAIVAAGLWRSALRRPAQKDSERASGQREIAVMPWSELPRPTLGRQPRSEEIAVLHSLAIHGALSLDTLERTLPFGRATLARALAAFSETGLIDENTGDQQISTTGYPAVRRELLSAGHQADDF